MEANRRMTAVEKEIEINEKRINEFFKNQFGDIEDSLVVPNLMDRFNDLGFGFEISCSKLEITDKKNGIFLGTGPILQNKDTVMVVDLGTTPSTDDIEDHIKCMEKLRRYADVRGDARKYLGAVAGVAVSDSVKNNALKNGFFVIVPSGDTFNIIAPEGKYHVREW